jgi:N-acetylmuramoyl-L-alanine amidase
MRPRRSPAAWLCLALALAPAPLARAATKAAPARPDRALYQEAQAALATLRASPKRQARRAEWEKVVLRFRKVVARYPQSAYCDDALLAIGDLYRGMATKLKSQRYRADADKAYRSLVAEYPSSSKGEQALFAALEIAREDGDRRRIAETGRTYLAAYPDSKRARDVKALLRRGAAVQEASLPSPPPPGLAQVFNLRFWSGDSSTRVVLDVERQVPIQSDRIRSPDRLWIDLDGTRLHPNLKDRSFPVGDGLLEQVRIAQNRDRVVRVVLDFKDVKDYSVLYLENPIRLVVDVRGTPRPQLASAETNVPAAPALEAVSPQRDPAGEPGRDGGVASRDRVPAAAPAPTPLPSLLPPAATPAPVRVAAGPMAAGPPPRPPESSPGGSATRSLPATSAPKASPPPPPEEAPLQKLPERRVSALVAPDPAPSPMPRPPRERVVFEGSAPARPTSRPAVAAAVPAAVASPDLPLPPLANRAGSYSLARQLGLGARKIVIDPGHGGHDPGSIGRAGLQEKDLVLDVALRLEKMLRTELGAEVLMTRSSDVFIPLEERTAIANSKGADLFLSIHANSSRSPRARGIETYYLNFATDPHAEEVAARENAISPATLKDLQNLVKAIALNSKIDESRDFATSIQEAMASGQSQAPNRGVRKGPFYVLIGANMPSILAEIAFVSHPDEEKLLKTPEHRDRIARSLLDGVRAYLETLNRGRPRQLTAQPTRSTLASRGGRR